MQTSLGRRNSEGTADSSKASWRILCGFIFKLAVYAAFALPSALRTGRPLAKYLDNFSVICVVAATVGALAALLLRQSPGGRALNLWDEALGFTGIYFLSRWLAIGLG